MRPPTALLAALALLATTAAAAGEQQARYVLGPEDGDPGPHGCGLPLVGETPVCFGSMLFQVTPGDTVTITFADAAWPEVAARACALQDGELPSCEWFGTPLLRRGCYTQTTVTIPAGDRLLIQVDDHVFDIGDGMPCGATTGTVTVKTH